MLLRLKDGKFLYCIQQFGRRLKSAFFAQITVIVQAVSYKALDGDIYIITEVKHKGKTVSSMIKNGEGRTEHHRFFRYHDFFTFPSIKNINFIKSVWNRATILSANWFNMFLGVCWGFDHKMGPVPISFKDNAIFISEYVFDISICGHFIDCVLGTFEKAAHYKSSVRRDGF